MTKEMKTEKDETIEEQSLPEQTKWENITDRPTRLRDLNITDYNTLVQAESDVESIEEWQGYMENILEVQTAEIIAEWSFKDSGALAIKTDANNGIWLSPTGILAKNGGVTTLTITSSGEATFAGSLAAGISITSPVITGGTITGSVLQTASTGLRVKMSSSPTNKIEFMDGSNVEGVLEIVTSGNDYYLKLGGTGAADPKLEITSSVGVGDVVSASMPGFEYGGGSSAGQGGLLGKDTKVGLEWTSSATATWSFDLGTYLAKISSDIIPSLNDTYDLGSSSYKWKNITISGTLSAYHISAITGSITTFSASSISASSYLKSPQDSTRSGSCTNGDMYYNTSTNRFMVCQTGSWTNVRTD